MYCLSKKIVIASLVVLWTVSVTATEIVGTWRNLSNGDYLELTESRWNYYKFDADCDIAYLDYCDSFYIDSDSTINGTQITSVSGLKDYYRQPVHCAGDSMYIGLGELWVRVDLPNVYSFSEYVDLRDSVEEIPFDSLFLFHVARLKHSFIKKAVTNLLHKAPCSQYPLELHLFPDGDSIRIQLSSDATWMYRDDTSRYILHLQGRDVIVVCPTICRWLVLTSRTKDVAIGYIKRIRCGKVREITPCDEVLYDSYRFYRSVTIWGK